MKHLLLTTIAAAVLVGCATTQSPEPTAIKAPDISIHKAAGAGNIEAVKQHLATGTDVNAKNQHGFYPLVTAASYGHNEIVELLIAKGADVNVKNRGKTPLDWAIHFKHPEIADLIRKHGGKNGTEDFIHIAAMAGNIEAVEQHLAAGTDVNAKDILGCTPLHFAAENGRKEIVERLISVGAEVNAERDDGCTPLHYAAANDRKEVAEMLIAAGADVNAKTKYGSTPLDWAIRFDETETGDLLRKHGGKTGEELKTEGK
jgi:ankyrin repeat protein